MDKFTTYPYRFDVSLLGVDDLTVDVADALFEAGCVDSSPHSEGCKVSVTFDREAGSLGEAIGSAITDIERAGFSVDTIVVDPVSDMDDGDTMNERFKGAL